MAESIDRKWYEACTVKTLRRIARGYKIPKVLTYNKTGLINAIILYKKFLTE